MVRSDIESYNSASQTVGLSLLIVYLQKSKRISKSRSASSKNKPYHKRDEEPEEPEEPPSDRKTLEKQLRHLMHRNL